MKDSTKVWTHDCLNCTHLGQTIGGGRMFDLYLHHDTLIARYGNEGAEYYSTLRGYARPNGHAELFCAEALAKEAGL